MMKSNWTVTLLSAGLLTLGSAALAAQDKAANSGSDQATSTKAAGSADRMNNGSGSADRAFMMKAAEGGMAEVEMGNVAKANASNDAVKNFGQRMVDDHTKAGDELKSIASQKNVTLPSSLNAKDQAMKDKMSAMKGDAFDRAYMSDMVKDHKKDIAEFEKEANSGKDPDVKAWAQKTLPTLKDHLKQAEETNAMVRGGGKPADKSNASVTK